MAKRMAGYPTPLASPRNLSNPLQEMAGLQQPIYPHPILDPQHPINQAKGKGWIPAPQHWNPMTQPIFGRAPPSPPTIQNKGQGYPYPRPYSYNQPAPTMCYGQPTQRGHPEIPQQRMLEHQGKGQVKAVEEMDEEHAPTESTEETEQNESHHRHSTKRSQCKKGARVISRKRRVWLAIKGQKVPAYYRSP